MRFTRIFAWLVVSTLVVVACSNGSVSTSTTSTSTTSTTVPIPTTTTAITTTTTTTVPVATTTTIPYLNTSSWRGEPARNEVLIEDFGFLASEQSILVNPEFVSWYEEEYQFTSLDGETGTIKVLILRLDFGSEEELIIDLPWSTRGGESNQYVYVGCYNPFDAEAPPEAQEPIVRHNWYTENIWALADRLTPGVRYPTLLADLAFLYRDPGYPYENGDEIVEYVHATMDLMRRGSGEWTRPSDDIFFRGAFVVDVFAIPPCLHGD